MYRDNIPVTENPIKKGMENEMKVGDIYSLSRSLEFSVLPAYICVSTGRHLDAPGKLLEDS